MLVLSLVGADKMVKGDAINQADGQTHTVVTGDTL